MEQSENPTLPLPGLEAFIDRLCAISDRYGRAYGIERTRDWYLLKVQEELGELAQAYLAVTGRQRPRPHSAPAQQDLAHEMADVMCMLMLMARNEGVDLNAAVTAKWLQWETVIAAEAVEAAAAQ